MRFYAFIGGVVMRKNTHSQLWIFAALCLFAGCSDDSSKGGSHSGDPQQGDPASETKCSETQCV